MGRRPKQTSLQRRHNSGQREYEKMLNMNNYQRIQIRIELNLSNDVIMCTVSMGKGTKPLKRQIAMGISRMKQVHLG